MAGAWFPKSLTPPRTTRQAAQSDWIFHHGTPDERTWEHGSSRGIHVGTQEAARQALNATIGKPLEGDWDGTREYGQTLLDPAQQTGSERGGEVRYPSGRATYSNGAQVPMDARPNIFPVRITGPMIGHPATPVEDDYANARMRAQITRGNARSGYFYRNTGEDTGSVSAAVPSAAHLERVHQPKTATRREPSAGIFGPTTGLDPLLFGDNGNLRPQVRGAVMERLDQCLRVDSGLAGSDWQHWTHVYLTGGSASEWAGSRPNETARDLDVIVAIDLAEAQGCSSFEGMNGGEAASALNRAFWKYFNADGWHLPLSEGEALSGGTWNLTAFCNQRAQDGIAAIRPYAAYDLTDGRWAVKPPHLPDHSAQDFDPAVMAHARAVADEARAVLRMPEPLRTREARDLWEHIHQHRCVAFSGEGTGWDDPGNIDEKYLAYAPRGLLGKIRDLAMAKTAAAGSPASLGELYHSTPYSEGFPYDDWMHLGTRAAAEDRARSIRPGDYGLPDDAPVTMHTVRLRGRVYPHVLTDEQATSLTGHGYPVRDIDDGLPSGEGYHVFPYRNEGEDAGSVSYLAHKSAIVPVGTETIPRHKIVPKTAAADNPVFYHGSYFRFEPGTQVEPHHGYAFFTTDAQLAEYHAGRSGHVHEVRPVAKTWTPDEESPSYSFKSRKPLLVTDVYSVDESRKRRGIQEPEEAPPITSTAAAQNPPCHYCGEPLGEEDVADGMSAHEECSDMRWCGACQEHHDDPQEAEEHNEGYTDWGNHLPFEDGIHRGITVRLPPDVHAVVHDGSRPPAERGGALARHLRENPADSSGEPGHAGGYGVHWTDHEPTAQAWGSGEGVMFGPSEEERSGQSSTHVVMHAASPHEDHIEDDPGALAGRNLLGYDHRRSEREVPLKASAPVHLTGVSWKRGGDSEWSRHDFGEGTRHLSVTGSANELPEEQPGLYWRAHVRKLPFDAEHAWSTPVGPGNENSTDVRRGYSSFSSPYHLAQYMPDFFGEDSDHRNVIAFHGRETGTGSDGEPLVVPGADHSCCGRVIHDQMPWHEFERRAWDTGHVPDYIEPGPWERRERHQASREYDGEDEYDGDPDRYVQCGQGHEHWGALGAAGLLVRHKGEDGQHRYLLQKRSPYVQHGSTWSTPGGALRQGEGPEEGAVREAGEEGMRLPADLRHHHTFTDDHGGWAYHTVVMDSPCRFDPSGYGESDWESEGHRWVTPQEAAKLPLHPGFAASWDKVRESGAVAKTAAWQPDTSGSDHSGVYLRFGDWPHDERSYSPAGGYHEEGVSVYDLDRDGDPSIGHGLDRGHEHEPGYCDVDEDGHCQNEPDEEPDNDPREEMQGRKTRAERARYYGSDEAHGTGHLVRGEMTGVGYDGEPLLKNVKRVGDWIDHRHLFLDQAGPHRLARDPSGDDYEPPQEKPPYPRRQGAAVPDRPRTASRGDQLAGMDDNTRASALAQDHVRLLHPLLTRPVETGEFRESPVLTAWLADAGHPRAGEAYVTGHPDPGAMRSSIGYGPDGEPAVMLHPDRRDYGTMAHEVAHHVTDLQTGRAPGRPHGPGGAHGDQWAGNYAGLLNRLSEGAGDDFLAERESQKPGGIEREAAAPGGGPQTVRPSDMDAADERCRRTAAAGDPAGIRMVNPEEYRKYVFPDYPVRTLPALARHLRKNRPEYYGKLRADIEANGVRTPVLVRFPGTPGHPVNKPQVMDGHHRGAIASELGIPVPVGDYHNEEHYQAAMKAGQPWFRENYDLKAGISREAAAPGGGPQRPKRTPGSAMVYLDVPHGTVAPYEGQEGGHHVALAYLPRGIGDEDFERVKQRAREAAARHAPMKATIGGGGVFPPGTPSDRRRVAVVPVHAPGIRELHDEFSDFDRAHYETYAPHVTRAQLGGHQDNPPPHPEASFPVTHLHVRRGDEVHSFPLTGPSRREASAGPWLHATPERFAENQLVFPMHGEKANFAKMPDSGGYAHFTNSQDRAAEYRDHVDDLHGPGAGRVYEVQPTGPHEADPEDPYSRRSAHPLRVLREHQGLDDGTNWDEVIDHYNVHREDDPARARHWLNHSRGEGPAGEYGRLGARHEAAEEQVDVYHHTDPEAARLIWAGKHFEPFDEEGRVYGTNLPPGHKGMSGADYGAAAVHLRVPRSIVHQWAGRQDEPEHYYDIDADDIRPEYFHRLVGEGMHREAVSGYDGLTDRSAMIYLDLPPGAVRPVPGGVDDSHVTLVYLGKDVSDKAFEEACRRVRQAAARCPPMDGVLRGIDIFPPSKSSDGKVVAFVPAYIGGIGRLRRELEDLSASEHADYRPHVTLAYLEEGDSLPAPHPAVPLHFTRVHLERGDDIVSFPLSGTGGTSSPGHQGNGIRRAAGDERSREGDLDWLYTGSGASDPEEVSGHPLQGAFRLEHDTVDNRPEPPAHRIRAFDHETGDHAGYISWSGKDGKIGNLDVRPQYRRNGLATAMYRAGKAYSPPARHGADRTDDGDLWAKSLGEKLPRRVKW